MNTVAGTRKEVTRRKLLEVAASQFAAGGYHGTSYNDLIASSGMSKGACYHHFRSKQELAIAVYEAKGTELLEKIAELGGASGAALERLFAQLRARARVFATDPSFKCLPRLAADFGKEPELRPFLATLHQNGIRQFAEVLRRGQSQGEIRSDVGPDTVARIVFATLVGITELAEWEGVGQAAPTEDLIGMLDVTLRPCEPGAAPSPASRGA